MTSKHLDCRLARMHTQATCEKPGLYIPSDDPVPHSRQRITTAALPGRNHLSLPDSVHGPHGRSAVEAAAGNVPVDSMHPRIGRRGRRD